MSNLQLQKLYVLIGLPGSGKSTFAVNKWGQDPNTIIVSSDAIREEMWETDPHSHQSQENHKAVFAEMQNRTIEAFKQGKDVVYDATNLSKKNRIKLINLVQERFPRHCEAIVFLDSLETCIKRQATRDRKVPEEVILRMDQRFELPSKEEGWDEIKYIKNGKDFRWTNGLSLMEYLRDLTECGNMEKINRLFYAAYKMGNVDGRNHAEDAPGDVMSELMYRNAFDTLKDLQELTGVPVFWDFANHYEK